MRVIQTAAGFCSQHPFTCTVDGFGTFSGRTIFAAVAPSAGWTALRDETFNALSRSCPGTANKDRRPFTPHLTVANRDIPPDAADRAFSHFAQLALSAQFPVTTVALFSRHGGRWEICCEAHS